MIYGKIINGKVCIIITIDTSARGYSGSIFYNKDDTVKAASDVIVEHNLKPIIVADGVDTKHLDWYIFEETASEITIFNLLNPDGESKLAEQNRGARIREIQPRLNALSQDIVQDIAGEIVPGIAERKAEFISLHNELRELLGLAPRETN